jgi:hypothetical protein
MIRTPFLTQLGPNDVLIGSYSMGFNLWKLLVAVNFAHAQCHPVIFSHCRRQVEALPPM